MWWKRRFKNQGKPSQNKCFHLTCSWKYSEHFRIPPPAALRTRTQTQHPHLNNILKFGNKLHYPTEVVNPLAIHHYLSLNYIPHFVSFFNWVSKQPNQTPVQFSFCCCLYSPPDLISYLVVFDSHPVRRHSVPCQEFVCSL